jgi:D-glycero-alpha-D-manno-heptose-7-phosphate kinase
MGGGVRQGSSISFADFSPARQNKKMPTFRSRAPLRLGLAGGGTDLSPYCDTYGGAVLNVTIDRYAYASLALTGGATITFRAGDLDVEEQSNFNQLDPVGPLQLHRAVYNRIVRDFNHGKPFGARLTTMVDAPPGSGLGSSSALVVAMVEAFRAALNLPLGRYDVAHLAYEIERKDLALRGGKQDQYAAAFGGINYIEFLVGDRVIVNPLRLAPASVNELQSSILICFSGQSRDSDKIIKDQIESVQQKDDALTNLHRLKEAAVAMKQAVLQGDITTVAALLDQSWEAKKRTSSSVSNSFLDSLWNVAHSNGAKAGKVSGAGGGGFMMFLVEPDLRPHLLRALRDAGGAPEIISFSNEGAEAWPANT